MQIRSKVFAQSC